MATAGLIVATPKIIFDLAANSYKRPFPFALSQWQKEEWIKFPEEHKLLLSGVTTKWTTIRMEGMDVYLPLYT